MTKLKLQFNIKTTLLVVTICALAMFSYVQSIRIRTLEEELQAGRQRELVKQQELVDAVSTPKGWVSEIPRTIHYDDVKPMGPTK